jgi:hypothetical protein
LKTKSRKETGGGIYTKTKKRRGREEKKHHDPHQAPANHTSSFITQGLRPSQHQLKASFKTKQQLKVVPYRKTN